MDSRVSTQVYYEKYKSKLKSPFTKNPLLSPKPSRTQYIAHCRFSPLGIFYGMTPMCSLLFLLNTKQWLLFERPHEIDFFIFLGNNLSITMKHRHTKLMVCPRVRHKWDTDSRWTLVRHVSDTQSYVSHLKNIIFQLRHDWIWLGHASDMDRTRVGHDWTQLGYNQNTT